MPKIRSSEDAEKHIQLRNPANRLTVKYVLYNYGNDTLVFEVDKGQLLSISVWSDIRGIVDFRAMCGEDNTKNAIFKRSAIDPKKERHDLIHAEFNLPESREHEHFAPYEPDEGLQMLGFFLKFLGTPAFTQVLKLISTTWDPIALPSDGPACNAAPHRFAGSIR